MNKARIKIFRTGRKKIKGSLIALFKLPLYYRTARYGKKCVRR